MEERHQELCFRQELAKRSQEVDWFAALDGQWVSRKPRPDTLDA